MQPASATMSAGAAAQFTVQATGSAPFTYQWRFNGNDIAGATGYSYKISNLQQVNAGSYSVLVSNGLGSTPSDAASLTVNPIVPRITTQPASVTVSAGDSAQFVVQATGSAPFTYQWRFNGNDIAGATGSSYRISNAQQVNAGSYSVLVSNGVGSTPSDAASLTVAQAVPRISTQPLSSTISAGEAAQFIVRATGSDPLRYQWRFNGKDIAGGTSYYYNVNNAQQVDAGTYTVLVSNDIGATPSDGAILTVNQASPRITTQPVGITVSAGETALFVVRATGTSPLAYQWRLNGNNLAAATNNYYKAINAQQSDAGAYSVLVSNAVGDKLSADATLSVVDAAPTIASQPQSISVSVGATATFSVRAVGTTPFQYQWAFNGAALPNGTNASLTIKNATSANAGNYSVLVSNFIDKAQSADAVLTVSGLRALALMDMETAPKSGGPPPQLSISRETDGHMKFILLGTKGSTLTVQFSRDLELWFPFFSVPDFDGAAAFAARNTSSLFYRLVEE
jgi:uncharacterized lipoprotein YbaY